MVYKNRTNKRGDEVIIYILNMLKFKLLPELSENIDNVYEYVSIEIDAVKSKNIIITCLKRPPGTNIELFNEHLEKLLRMVKENKSYFLVGDFNINLINSENHTATTNFVELLFSFDMYPLINKPTRISFDTATLIDNIFTNSYRDNLTGILINDISDHFPIFTVIQTESSKKKQLHQKLNIKEPYLKKVEKN